MNGETLYQQRIRKLRERHSKELEGCREFCRAVAEALAERMPDDPATDPPRHSDSFVEPRIGSVELRRKLAAHLASMSGRLDPSVTGGYSMMMNASHDSCRESGVPSRDGSRLDGD